jgi:hypothetical protein
MAVQLKVNGTDYSTEVVEVLKVVDFSSLGEVDATKFLAFLDQAKIEVEYKDRNLHIAVEGPSMDALPRLSFLSALLIEAELVHNENGLKGRVDVESDWARKVSAAA